MADSGPSSPSQQPQQPQQPQSSYPTVFYTAAEDNKGHRDKTPRLNVPPAVMSRVGALIASRRVPEFRTSQDVLRDAMVVGMEVRAQQLGDPLYTEIANTFARSAEMERLEILQREQDGLLERSATFLAGFNNSPVIKAQVVQLLRAEISAATDRTYKRQLEDIVSRYPLS